VLFPIFSIFFTVYCLALLNTFRIANFTLFWVWMEFLSLILFLLLLININFTKTLANLFLINIYCSLAIYLFFYINKNLALFFLLRKNSIFPIIWIYLSWLYYINNLNIFLITTLNKIPFFIIFYTFFDYAISRAILLYSLVNILNIFITITKTNNLKIFYLLSSILNSNWLVLRSFSLFLILTYTVVYYFFCAIFLFRTDWKIHLISIFAWSRLPGRPLFLFKLINFNFLIQISRQYCFLLLITNVFIVLCYFSFILKTFTTNIICITP